MLDTLQYFQAVAERVAGEDNPITLINELEAGGQPPVTLQSITLSILNREQGKLDQIQLQDPTLHERLYTPEEQITRLVARTYDTVLPTLPEMSQQDLITYTGKGGTLAGRSSILGRRWTSAIGGL